MHIDMHIVIKAKMLFKLWKHIKISNWLKAQMQ